MPRPCKKRYVDGNLNSNYFKPIGIPLSKLEENIISRDEFEAIKLIYDEDLDQEKASEKMKISQPTFSRILKSGIKKLAKGIIHGKAIKINVN
jgi:predicted DNA-binding protein (UPF0251 family)